MRPSTVPRTASRRRWSAWLLLGLWILGGVLALRGLWSLGGTNLAPPPLAPQRWPQWWAGRDPVDAVAGVVRLVTMAAVGYLVLVALAHLGACLVGGDTLRRRTARLNPRVIAALAAAAALGSGPAAGAAAAAAPAGAPRGAGATMTVLDNGTGGQRGSGGEGATMTLLDGSTGDPTAPGPGSTPPIAVAAVPVSAGASGPLTVIVRPGDHFWSIAERRVVLAVGGRPTEEQVRAYWVALVEANRDRLVDPGNADLILPGQELVLPG